jgi:radical SAM protein with 4Fe4S-binding SPASM domain
MCPNGAGMVSIPKGYMDYVLYQKIIGEIKGYASLIILALGGESLLHPEFFKMVKYASSQGINVMLNTNATLLDKACSQKLISSGISYISFAFDGFNKDTYERARRGANFEKTLENILYFVKLKKEKKLKKPYTVLSMLKLGIGKFTQEEQSSFLKKFTGLIDEIRLREVSSWGRIFKDCDKFSYKKFNCLWAPCSRLWSSVCIAWNGDVLPCIYNINHEYTIGDIKAKKLSDIWNSEKMVQIRKAMIEGRYLEISPLCENCIVLGIPPLLGIPSGIRLTLSNAITNILGYRFERIAIYLANKLKKEEFVSATIK